MGHSGPDPRGCGQRGGCGGCLSQACGNRPPGQGRTLDGGRETGKPPGDVARRGSKAADETFWPRRPGNPESYQFFADLCFQLGETDEGFESLRRAVRVNPTDTKAMLTLADTLAEQFRTEEAIELYWRAFEKATDLDGKLGIVSKLTSLYLQRSQFDRLVARLEREKSRGESTTRDDHLPGSSLFRLGRFRHGPADLGEASRRECPRYRPSWPASRGLAESEGDVQSAAKYQKQLNEISPSDEGQTPSGPALRPIGRDQGGRRDLDRASPRRDQEPHRMLRRLIAS